MDDLRLDRYRPGLTPIEVVRSAAALGSLLDDETAKARTSVRLMDPGGRGNGAEHARFLDASGRGVRIRMIFQHGARYDVASEYCIRILSRAGARCRTADRLPLRLVVFDDATGVLGVDDDEDDDTVALVVRRPPLITTLVRDFEHAWLRATPSTDPRPFSVPDGLSRSILNLLATGAKDDAIARRLNISVRTCRRHISDLMDSLGVASRFQAGIEAHRRGLV